MSKKQTNLSQLETFEQSYGSLDDPKILRRLYQSYQPKGSGPLGVMRMVCVMIEKIAQLKGIDLNDSDHKGEDTNER